MPRLRVEVVFFYLCEFIKIHVTCILKAEAFPNDYGAVFFQNRRAFEAHHSCFHLPREVARRSVPCSFSLYLDYETILYSQQNSVQGLWRYPKYTYRWSTVTFTLPSVNVLLFYPSPRIAIISGVCRCDIWREFLISIMYEIQPRTASDKLS